MVVQIGLENFTFGSMNKMLNVPPSPANRANLLVLPKAEKAMLTLSNQLPHLKDQFSSVFNTRTITRMRSWARIITIFALVQTRFIFTRVQIQIQSPRLCPANLAGILSLLQFGGSNLALFLRRL